jgi:ATP-binding protein involved in chromosome partitioning
MWTLMFSTMPTIGTPTFSNILRPLRASISAMSCGVVTMTAPVTGAVIVTTPQDIALIDARKGLKMFEKVGVPIVGIVENMSVHICSNCGHVEHIFGEGGAQKMCNDYGVPFLGALPLDIRIREQADSGRPTVVADPDGKVAQIYRDIARKVAISVAEKAADFSAKFPSIVVQNT